MIQFLLIAFVSFWYNLLNHTVPIGRTRKWREGFAARIFFAEAQTLFQCQPKQNFPLEELLSVELWGVCLTLLAR